jgi:hypothetical protein
MKKQLKFNSGNSLEIDLLENGDIRLVVYKNDLDVSDELSLDVPNPLNGGGDLEDYKKIKEFYELI